MTMLNRMVASLFQLLFCFSLPETAVVDLIFLPLMQGLSLAVSSHNGEDFLVSFGGYYGRYSNEVNFDSDFF